MDQRVFFLFFSADISANRIRVPLIPKFSIPFASRLSLFFFFLIKRPRLDRYEYETKGLRIESESATRNFVFLKFG